MSTWSSLPSDIRKLIIDKGKEVLVSELAAHKILFNNCMLQLVFKFAGPHVCFRLRILNIGGIVNIHLM